MPPKEINASALIEVLTELYFYSVEDSSPIGVILMNKNLPELGVHTIFIPQPTETQTGIPLIGMAETEENKEEKYQRIRKLINCATKKLVPV